MAAVPNAFSYPSAGVTILTVTQPSPTQGIYSTFPTLATTVVPSLQNRSEGGPPRKRADAPLQRPPLGIIVPSGLARGLPALYPVRKDVPQFLSARFQRPYLPRDTHRDSHRQQSSAKKDATSATGSFMTDTAGKANNSKERPDSPLVAEMATGSAMVEKRRGGRKDGEDPGVGKSGAAGGAAGNDGAGGKGDPQESYTPFQLGAKSSFNLANISERERRKLSKMTLAKYQAYEKPSAIIVQNIDESSSRARQFLRQEHRKISEQCATMKNLLAKKRGCMGDIEEKVATGNAQKAMERMKQKIHQMEQAREFELSFLVEGQPNSIEAIRLKEYLSAKCNAPRNLGSYSERDRLRVEELLSIRGP